MRYRSCTAILTAVALLAGSAVALARAQSASGTPITIVVGFAPGGLIDVIARLVGQKMSERLGRAVVVENRAGAGGNIAHRTVAGAPADGTTVLAATTSLAINESLFKSRGYTAGDFTALSMSASTPEFIGNNPSGPRTLKELLATAKERPINFASPGAGSASYIVTEYFFRTLAKVPATHIPYAGGAPAINATLANQVDMVAGALAGGFVPHVHAGRIRGLAVASTKRVALIPDVPTYSEASFPGFTAAAWTGFFVPVKTPPEVVAKLHEEIVAILKLPDVVAKLEALGFEPTYQSQPEAQAQFRAEIDKWAKMVEAVGLQIK
jgi:tripartite-type tricarboxylate transporter receptor subunit TctC